MAISGDLRVSAALGSYPGNSTRTSLPLPSKVDFSVFLEGRGAASEVIASKLSRSGVNGHSIRCHARRPFASGGGYKLSSSSISQEAESFLLNAINMSFFERLNLAWKIIFPSPTAVKKSNANIAKQRLQMILFSDRCAVSDEAKEKIVSNIVNALSDFVEIESQDKVELNVSTDAALGTIYSVTVPVRRVRTEYQAEDQFGTITNIEYKNNGGISGSVDVKFDFYVPEE